MRNYARKARSRPIQPRTLEENIMIRKLVMAGLALAALSAPAFAATDYYVAKNATTRKCEIVQNKPDGKIWMQVGTHDFATKSAAEVAMKAAAECK
jgi:hypothetical protein